MPRHTAEFPRFTKAELKKLSAEVTAFELRHGKHAKSKTPNGAQWSDLKGKLETAARSADEVQLTAGEVQRLFTSIRSLEQRRTAPASSRTQNHRRPAKPARPIGGRHPHRTDLRAVIQSRLAAGSSIRAIARDLGVSRRTVQHWARRSLTPPNDRPAASNRTPATLEREVMAIRTHLQTTDRAHGPRAILTVLRDDPLTSLSRLPSPRTIARIIRRAASLSPLVT